MERYYRKYIEALREKTDAQNASRPGPNSGTAENTSAQQHYSVANRDRAHVDLYALAGKHMGDPALKVGNGLPPILVSHTNTLPGLCDEAQGPPPCLCPQQAI